MNSFEEWELNASKEEVLLALMNQRQRQVLVHSFLYYQMSENLISDGKFDRFSHEIARLMKDNPELAKETAYYKDFKDFDGGSGFLLPYTMPNIQQTGLRLLRYSKEKK